MEDWAELRRLHRAERMPVRATARKPGISRTTVCRATADDAPPTYQRAPKGSVVDAVEPQIREPLEQWPDMPATAIVERIGWDRSLTVLKDRVRDLRPAHRPADPVRGQSLGAGCSV
ncbi:helix-turn-helix domain-containing protein [Streptomyces griseoincarnatus]